MKVMKQVQGATSKLFASTAGIAVLFIVLAAAVGSWKRKDEKFTDCSMSSSCSL